MSKTMPSNMLRTRRRDNNVKPNRRLDRKSSRGMIYENEELRLKSINFNAEIERGHTDIKKLKRENEMLKKEIWFVRDQYDKLDKMLKRKDIDLSSSSTTCSSASDSESCSSCTEEWNCVETSQNRENVQKTCDLKKLQEVMETLSVVPEENSTATDNSSNRTSSLPPQEQELVLKADQSYPVYDATHKASTLPDKTPRNFFSPIKPSKSFDDSHFEQKEIPLYPEQLYAPTSNNANNCQPRMSTSNERIPPVSPNVITVPNGYYTTEKNVDTNASNFYQNMVLTPRKESDEILEKMDKTSTDLIVKLDNRNFNSTPSRSTFSNGGNLEELLNDIETISRDIYQISRCQQPNGQQCFHQHCQSAHGSQDFLARIEGDADLTYLKNPEEIEDQNCVENNEQRPFKTELNVTLMPTAMPLIGVDKYKNIQRSLDSLHSRSLDNLTPSAQPHMHVHFNQSPELSQPNSNMLVHDINQSMPSCSNQTPSYSGHYQHQNLVPPNSFIPLPMTPVHEDENPFYFGFNDGTTNSDYFNSRYNPEHFTGSNEKLKPTTIPNTPNSTTPIPRLSQTNLDSIVTSNENVEDLQFCASKPTESKYPSNKINEPSEKKRESLSIRRKVSIHFKGRNKDKNAKKPNTLQPNNNVDNNIPTITEPLPVVETKSEKKPSAFDIKISSSSEGKSGKVNSSAESSAAEAKTPSSSDNATNKNSNTDNKGRPRKSASASPERGQKDKTEKKHKKHRKGARSRRNTAASMDRLNRERSYSVCTDRSNMFYGFGYGNGMFYDSDREESLSSCDTGKTRKMSSISNIPLAGKLPWCACWGNGCL